MKLFAFCEGGSGASTDLVCAPSLEEARALAEVSDKCPWKEVFLDTARIVMSEYEGYGLNGGDEGGDEQ